jgi:hypothetical protein
LNFKTHVNVHRMGFRNANETFPANAFILLRLTRSGEKMHGASIRTSANRVSFGMVANCELTKVI